MLSINLSIMLLHILDGGLGRAALLGIEPLTGLVVEVSRALHSNPYSDVIGTPCPGIVGPS